MTDERLVPAARRRTAVVKYNRAVYLRDLSLCRRALTQRQVEGEYLSGLTELAAVVGCSRSTTNRFFNGRNISMEVTLKLLNGIKLTFEDVHTPILDTDQ
jgi:hypothetical protein